MLKIGLIGAGYMGGMHSACYEALKELGASVTAVADLREDKRNTAAAQFQAACYKTGMELIEQADVDVVDICLPTYLHTEHALAAMKMGRAVFIEKPVCLTPEEGRTLLEAQRKYGSTVMVGQCIRFWDEYVWLKEAIDGKRYGRIQSAVFQRVSPYPDWSWNSWLHRSECSGTVALDMHVHDIDFIRFLMGDPIGISAAASRSGGAIYQIFTTLEYPDAAVHAEACWDYPKDFPFSMSFRVKCEQATIVYDSSSPEGLVVYPRTGGALKPEIVRQFRGESGAGGNISSLGGYYNELRYFVECLNTGREPVIAPLCEAVQSMELCRRGIELAGGTDL